MITLNKKTIVSTSIGTLMAAAGGMWVVSGELQAAAAQIAMNTQSIQQLELRSVNSEIARLKTERRSLNRQARQYPNNTLLIEQLEEVQDEIDALIVVRDCMIDPTKEVCQ